MTVLMREEMNDADLAWAAADALFANGTDPLLRAHPSITAERAIPERLARDGLAVEPAVLCARGIL